VKCWTKIFIFSAGFLVIAIAATPLFVDANTFRPALEKQLTATLGRSVKVGTLKLSLLSGSLIATNLSIADDPKFSTEPFLKTKGLHIGVSLRLLIFSRQVNVRSFQIDSPQVNLIRAENGTWNFSSIGHVGAEAISKESVLELSDLPVDRIAIEQGRVEVRSLPDYNEPLLYEHVHATARDFSFAVQFPFEIKASLPAQGILDITGHVGPINRSDAATSPADIRISAQHIDPVAIGFLNSKANLSLLADISMHTASDGEMVTTSGTIHIENLRLLKDATPSKPIDLAYTGKHRLKENSGLIEDATGKVGTATIHATGRYQLVAHDPGDPLVNLKIGARDLPIDELQSLMTAASIHLPEGSVLQGGQLSLDFDVVGHPKSLLITGPIELDNTRLIGFDIGSKIHGVAALGAPKTGDTTDIEKLRLTVRVTNGGALVDHIDAVIPTMGELTGSGTVSSSKQLDFNLVVKIDSAKGIGKIGVFLLTKLNGVHKTSGNVSGVPIRVVGTADEPYITADVTGIAHEKIKSIASFFRRRQ
jgi:AsmA protein